MDPKRVFDFGGKSVLVIGASLGGIGTAIAAAFKACGATVVITGVEEAPAEPLRGAFPYMQLDVTDDKAVEALAAATPKLDVLINCAGVSGRGKTADVALFQRILDLNLTGTYRACLAFLPQLTASRGSIVNIGSMYGHLGSPKVVGYGAGKAGIHQLTKSLAILWAEYGIRVNAIAPGFIATPGTAVGRADPVHYAAVMSRTPMKRWGESEDIAGPAVFLASPAASFVTGVTLSVDGGYMAV
jgi:NAD(P)-dependent dehydrogenase (short-subunit alcohol dehydrogenase family)